jgi:hypothetical protein
LQRNNIIITICVLAALPHVMAAQAATPVSGELSFHLSAEVSNVLSDGSSPRPIIRQNRWSSYVTVPIKKPTIVFSSDDNTTKHIMQLEVTATPRT